MSTSILEWFETRIGTLDIFAVVAAVATCRPTIRYAGILAKMGTLDTTLWFDELLIERPTSIASTFVVSVGSVFVRPPMQLHFW